jgi:hypothetical protein
VGTETRDRKLIGALPAGPGLDRSYCEAPIETLRFKQQSSPVLHGAMQLLTCVSLSPIVLIQQMRLRSEK